MGEGRRRSRQSLRRVIAAGSVRVFSAFADLSLGVNEPMVGLGRRGVGYPPILRFAATFATAPMPAAGISRRAAPRRRCELTVADRQRGEAILLWYTRRKFYARAEVVKSADTPS